ncbi:hypothetical protein [Catellatospora sp. IY07-71]|uniref:hypothetical protein n=1 Tax=Catellatospora sp. IY07-71 TaxID=2728827 RepID=UPI001BB3E2DC|nr:hypothetical protein [Catellatospora sp. IY07-71]
MRSNPAPARVVQPFVPGTISPFGFSHYIRSKLHQLSRLPRDWDGNGGVPVNSVASFGLVGIMGRVSDRRTVYPFLSPFDKGGVLAEWHAGQQKIEVEVDRVGDIYVFATDERGRAILDAELDESVERKLRQLLNLLSQKVNKENPTWRRLFDR